MKCGDENLPSIYFLAGGYWVEVNPKDYAIDISAAQDESICGLAIAENDIEEITFGVPLLRGFYSVFDVANDQLGLVPTTLSNKQALTAGTQPTEYFIAPIPWNVQFTSFFKNN